MPKNEITKTEKAPITLSGAQSLQVKLVGEIEEASSQLGATLTDYGKRCIINAIGGLVQLCKSQDIDMSLIDPTLLRLQLANVGYIELNYSAGEIYFDLRKQVKEYVDQQTKKKKYYTTYQVTIKPQGIGNEQLTRKYGVGLKPQTGLHNPYMVREGDEFEYPQFDGIKIIPPKWRIKNPDGKVILVCYCAEKTNGDVEYLMATRESVKANIIAQIRQNMMYDRRFMKKKRDGDGEYLDKEAREKFYQELNAYAESHTLEELLSEPTYAECVNPTYTSGGSKEQMILRKMKNNALKNYPKDYGQPYVFDAVKEMYEDRDDSLDEPPMIVNRSKVIDQVNEEIEEEPVEDAPKDFSVNDEGEVIRNEETPKEVAEENQVEQEEPATEDDTEADEEDYGF